MIITYLSAIIALIIGSYTDIKSRTIPIYLFPATAIVNTTLVVSFSIKFNFIYSLLGALLCLIAYFSVVFFGGGGTDIIMMTCLGWMFGVKMIICVVFVTTLIYAIGLVVNHFIKKEPLLSLTLPYVPFVLAGTFISICISLIF